VKLPIVSVSSPGPAGSVIVIVVVAGIEDGSSGSLHSAGQHGSFYAGYSDVPMGGQACKVSTSVEVWPPNDAKHFTLKLAIAPCGGLLTLSPVVHGRLPL
jgi:hypothetical protein